MYILRIAQQELNPDRGALLKHEKNIKNLWTIIGQWTAIGYHTYTTFVENTVIHI